MTSLSSGLPGTQEGGATPVEPPQFLSALTCAAAMPLDPAVLCKRLDGHQGPHQSDGQDAWKDDE